MIAALVILGFVWAGGYAVGRSRARRRDHRPRLLELAEHRERHLLAGCAQIGRCEVHDAVEVARSRERAVQIDMDGTESVWGGW